MKIVIISLTSLFFSSALSKEFKCSEIKEREFKINATTAVQIQNINGVCSFGVETSKTERKFDYSDRVHKASRNWSFQSSGKILVLNNYFSGPTDSSSTSYKAYQTFPNHHELKLNTFDDGTFSMSLPNGTSVFFNSDGSFDQNRTVDLKIKDTPISIPDIPKSMSEERYEQLNHLSYNNPKKSSIRIFHRKKYAALTSRSIGLETKKGMYIPLGVEMGKIPGNDSSKSFTLFGIDDEKLCKQIMPAHYFFNYLVKCSINKPNSRCACKHTSEEANKLFNKNKEYEKELKSLNFKVRSLLGSAQEEMKSRISQLELLFNENLYKEIYFNCTLDRHEALKFVQNKKIAKDHREIEGIKAKDTDKVIEKLIASGNCPRLKSLIHDCVDCRKESLIDTESINTTYDQMNDIIEKVED